MRRSTWGPTTAACWWRRPSPRGFRVVEAYSRIVRLGEGLSQTGQLSEAAMDRSMAALKVCAEKIRRRKVLKVKAVATQACRGRPTGPTSSAGGRGDRPALADHHARAKRPSCPSPAA
jgi:hypothetical protein